MKMKKLLQVKGKNSCFSRLYFNA